MFITVLNLIIFIDNQGNQNLPQVFLYQGRKSLENHGHHEGQPRVQYRPPQKQTRHRL